MAFAAGTMPGPRGRVPPLVTRLRVLEARRRLAGYLIATVGTAALTAGLLPFRNDIAPPSKGFGYLVVVPQRRSGAWARGSSSRTRASGIAGSCVPPNLPTEGLKEYGPVAGVIPKHSKEGHYEA